MLPQLRVCALVLPLLTGIWSCRAQNVVFSVDRFQEGENILLDGNCGVSGDGFLQQLAQRDAGLGNPHHAFRAVYPHPVQFYDAGTGAEASFRVHFSFAMESVEHKGGSGLSFIIAPERTVAPGSGGAGLGLHRNSRSANATHENSDPERPLLAVELDSCSVGLNVNGVVSAKTHNLPACGLSLHSAYHPEMHMAAFIDYSADSHDLRVYMAPDSRSEALLVLSYSGLNLAGIVQPYSYVGFTGSTLVDHYSQQTTIFSWSVSTRGLPQTLAASALPQTLATVPRRTLDETHQKVGWVCCCWWSNCSGNCCFNLYMCTWWI